MQSRGAGYRVSQNTVTLSRDDYFGAGLNPLQDGCKIGHRIGLADVQRLHTATIA